MSERSSSYFGTSFKEFLNRTFATMAIGLAVSGITAFLIASNIVSIIKVFGYSFFYLTIGLAIAEFVVAIYFSTNLYKMSLTTARTCFFLYSVLTGASLSTLLLVYSSGNVVMAFLTTAVLFTCMSIIGNTTNIDLSKYTNIFIIALPVMIVMSIVNIFLGSSLLDLLITYIGVIIFLGLIAFDMQKLRNIYNSGIYGGETYEKVMLYGAFELYLDFINLFIRIVRMLGMRSNRRN